MGNSSDRSSESRGYLASSGNPNSEQLAAGGSCAFSLSLALYRTWLYVCSLFDVEAFDVTL